MDTYDYNAVVHNGEVYCIGCLPADKKENEDVFPIFANSEWEYIPVCCKCGVEHDYIIRIGEENQMNTDCVEIEFDDLTSDAQQRVLDLFDVDDNPYEFPVFVIWAEDKPE